MKVKAHYYPVGRLSKPGSPRKWRLHFDGDTIFDDSRYWPESYGPYEI